MLILGIETSCDETSASVVEDGRKILSLVTASQIKEHIKFGGVVPEIASRMHIECIDQVVGKAFFDAGVSPGDLSAVAVTAYPGLIGALLVGLNFAKGMAYSYGLPLVAVHHIKAHVAANYIEFPELSPPFMALVASGGHSSIMAVDSYTGYRLIGRTRDDAAGECYDKIGRAMGLPYPGGVHIDKNATGDPDSYHFPAPKVEGSPFDMSFSGLKTAAVNMIHNIRQKGGDIDIPGFAASINKTVAEALASRLVAAAKFEGMDRVVIAGGVSANSALRARAGELCAESGISLYMPPLSLCGDNAAMVASQGYYEYISGNLCDLTQNASGATPI